MFLNVTPWFIWAERPYCEFLFNSASLRGFALAVRQGLNPDCPPFTPSQGQLETVAVRLRWRTGFTPKIYHRPRGRLPLIAVRLWPRFRLPHASPQGLRCGLSERRPPLRGFHCPLGSVQQPKLTEYNQIQLNTTKYNQIQPNTTEYNRIQPNTTKYNQIQLKPFFINKGFEQPQIMVWGFFTHKSLWQDRLSPTKWPHFIYRRISCCRQNYINTFCCRWELAEGLIHDCSHNRRYVKWLPLNVF